jgi:hypothetical protein
MLLACPSIASNLAKATESYKKATALGIAKTSAMM